MVDLFPIIDLVLGVEGRDSVYIKNSSGDWIEFDAYESFKIVKKQNQVSEFELVLADIEDSDKLIVKEFAEIIFLSETNLILKGRIQKVTYSTAYDCTITGFGSSEAKLLEKEVTQNSNTSATWQDSKRGQWTNVSAQTVANELLSSNTDGSSPWVINPTTTGLFDTDYGNVSVRFEYANRLNALAKLSEAINYEWRQYNASGDYDTDYLEIASLLPNSTKATVSQETFAITGASANCSQTSKEKDITNLINYASGLGYGDGVNQLKTSCYNASAIYSTLSSDITISSTTISLSDASSFPSSGTIRIMEEQVTYSGKSSNDLTGCTRGANSTTAYSHKAGVFVEKHLAVASAESGSSIYDNGLIEGTLTYTNVIDRDTLELIISQELLQRKDPIVRINVIPNEPLETAGAREIGELVTITDAESDISDDYRIVGMTYTDNYGVLEMEIECSNRSLTFIEQMQKQKEASDNLGKYMQGATNIDSISLVDNMENETSPTANPAPGALDLYFDIPTDAVAINLVKLSYRLQAPKTWSSNTSAGSAHSHSLTISSSGSHGHTITINSEAASGSHALIGFASGSLYSETGVVGGGVNTSSSASHTHTGQATDNESSHTHSVAYDLASQSYTATDIRIFTSNDASSTPSWTERTADLETAKGSALNATENTTESALDLTSYFSSTGWKGIRIVTNGNARAYASVVSKVFIESTT